MIPAPFGYERPSTLEDALAFLGKHGEGAKIISGGHSLLPVLKARLAHPAVLIDIGRIPGLSGISLAEGALIVGAMTAHAEIEADGGVRRACPLLAETAGRIGDLQVRNRGTIGGSLAHADPAADYPAAMLALDAEIVATGPGGARAIAAEDFFTGTYATVLAPDEILTSVRIPLPEGARGGAYRKAAQQASGFAVCGVAAQLSVAADGAIAACRVGITGVAARAYRAKRVEEALAGRAPSEEAVRAAAAHAAEGVVDPLDDFYASAEFRGQLARVYTERALAEALRRAKK